MRTSVSYIKVPKPPPKDLRIIAKDSECCPLRSALRAPPKNTWIVTHSFRETNDLGVFEKSNRLTDLGSAIVVKNKDLYAARYVVQNSENVQKYAFFAVISVYHSSSDVPVSSQKSICIGLVCRLQHEDNVRDTREKLSLCREAVIEVYVESENCAKEE
mmetsp:Transcript_66042/g.137943  ORF Transcript_66042/g.137943 Transcript_66042/m.137943 type:complete len:159 (+) Transcript_66042:425-901(+)